MTLDLFSDAAWAEKSVAEKFSFFREDEYFEQFYDDVAGAAKYHRRRQNEPQETTELIVAIYEKAIAYATYICNHQFHDIALEKVIDEVCHCFYAWHFEDEEISPCHIIPNNDDGRREELGAVIESMCAVLCYDCIETKDKHFIKALYTLREWVYCHHTPYIDFYHWHFWNLLAERIPDYGRPSVGEIRQHVKKLEAENEKLQQEVLKLKNIPADETEEERDDEEVAEGRFPHRITVGYLLSLMGIKSKENIKNQAALKRALQGLTGVPPTSVNNYLEGFNLALRNNQSELDRLNKELRDAGLPEFHIELDSE